MPIYEYLCPKCKQVFSLRRAFSAADEPAECAQCGVTGKKLLSTFAAKPGAPSFYLQVPGKDAFRPPPEEILKT